MTGEASEYEREERPPGMLADGVVPTALIDAFVSYASPDAPVANSVVDALEKHRLRCWIAPRDVIPGALYADGIARAINSTKVFVLVLSVHAIASPHVGKEIERASSKRRPIIALHIDSAPLTPAFEYFLSESQWIDFQPERIEAATAKLVEGIRRHLNAETAIDTSMALGRPTSSRQTAMRRPTWWVAGGAAAVLLALVAYFGVDHYRRSKHMGIATVSQKDKIAPVGDAERTITTAFAPPAASIAVLAFSDLSAEGNQGYFSDGIAEEILNVLAHVNGLKVASRTSSFQFRKSDLSAPAIAQKLGVRHILEGSVRKAGDTVRITAQLIDASTDQHEWSQSFDRPLSTANLFAIQDEIAKSIVDHLAATMGSPADITKPAVRKADTADEGAYDLYLNGRSLFIGRTAENLAEAARFLRAAVTKDPKFARAWEMLGAVLVTSHYWGVGNASDIQAGAEAVDMALHLDPNLSLAHAVRGEIQLDMVPSSGAAGWEDSSGSYSRAIELDETNATAYAWRAANYAALGYLDRAMQDYQKCLNIDPAYELCRAHLAFLYLFLGRTEDAVRFFERTLENGYIIGASGVFARVAAARGY